MVAFEICADVTYRRVDWSLRRDLNRDHPLPSHPPSPSASPLQGLRTSDWSLGIIQKMRHVNVRLLLLQSRFQQLQASPQASKTDAQIPLIYHAPVTT